MTRIRILLPMIFLAVLGHSAVIKMQSGQAQEPASAPSSEKSNSSNSTSGGSGPSSDQDKTTQVRGQSERSSFDQEGTNFAAASTNPVKRRPSASQAKPVSARQPASSKTRATGVVRESPSIISDAHPTGPANSTGAKSAEMPTKTLQHGNVPAAPPPAALKGQQFKNSRDPGARMAASGGPANSTRGATGISGSDIKRKP
jgi:cytoskeletal protein RodZ